MSVVPSAAPTRLGTEESVAVRAALESVLAGGPWILGEPVERFESEFATYLGVPEVVGVGNGTDALVLGLAALGLSPGAGVLVAAVEGGYAATAARMLGLRPLVMDVDELSMGPVVSDAQRADDAGVEAIIVTHLHGDAVPLDEIDRWRGRRGLALVEDCAQAHGLRVGGRHVGATGEVATYSFYPTKNLGAIGDAGAVTCADAAVAKRLRALRQYGWGERYRVEHAGGRNSRLDTLQAAVLAARLPFLDGRNARRRAIANRYRAALPQDRRLHGDPATTVAHHAVAIGADRDGFQQRLEARGITTSVHYPYLVTEMPGLDIEPASVPTSSRLRDRMLSLPCFPELTDAEVDRVCEALGAEAAR